MSLDDLPLDRPASPVSAVVASRDQPSWLRWAAVGGGALVASALLTFWWMSRTQPTATAPASTSARDVGSGSSRPKRQQIDLPALAASDSWLRALVSGLSNHPLLARLLTTPALIRGAVLSVVQIGDGRTPDKPLRLLRPAQRLQIDGASGRAEPQSYARWDAAAAALSSVSPADAAQLYVNVKPLFDEAYIELGSPDGDFDAALVRAIRVLTVVPVLSEDPVLVRRPGYLDHDDPALRALRPVQKQFLLLGADNQRRVLAWLRQFAARLDLKLD